MERVFLDFFLNSVNLSITAGWIVLGILVFRPIFKRAPKWINCALWLLVGIRLVFPFSIESALSLIPSAETLPPSMVESPSFDINTGFNMIDAPVNDYLGDHYFEGVTVPANNAFNITKLFAIVWIVGVIAMLFYTAVSYLRLRNRMRTATVLQKNIRQSEFVSSPFVLGIIKPTIYLPYNMDETDMEHVIAHETAHIERRDHLIKPIGFLILAFYWFNPLLWLAYVLLCRDIELACDEKVIKKLNQDERKAYSNALLTCSIKRRSISACPLAFGEVSVKERVKSVLSYKKPAFWIILVALIASAVLCVCFLTNPKAHEIKNKRLDLSDSNELLLGSEVGLMKYADGDTVIFSSTGGIYIYDTESKKTVDRIPYETMHNFGFEFTTSAVSPDGKYIYLGKEDFLNPIFYTYKYDTEKRTFSEIEPISTNEVEHFKITELPSPSDSQYYGEFAGVDSSGWNSGNCVDFGDSFVYIRLPNGGKNMGDIEIIFCEKESGNSTAYYPFKEHKEPTNFNVMERRTAEIDPLKLLTDSIHFEGDKAFFTIPSRAFNPSGVGATLFEPTGWNIIINGRIEPESGNGMSVHFFEEENESKTWQADKVYEIDMTDATELTMYIEYGWRHIDIDLLKLKADNDYSAGNTTEVPEENTALKTEEDQPITPETPPDVSEQTVSEVQTAQSAPEIPAEETKNPAETEQQPAPKVPE